MSKTTFHAVSGFSATKNPTIFMAITPSGLISTRKVLVEKACVKDEQGKFIAPEGCAIIVRHTKKGEYLYGVDENNKPIPAPQDSSRVWAEGMEGFVKENEGNPVYLAGSFPKATTDYSTVLRITSVQALQGEATLKNLQAQLA